MSKLARRNGWRGFDCAERVDGGWRYLCDGMPTMMGCGAEVVLTRRWSTVGVKRASGWLVMFGSDDPGRPGDDGKGNDTDVVLTFCPECRTVVKQQT